MQVKISCGKGDLDRLHKLETELDNRGISFDTGYNIATDERDWSLDWSLKGATAEEVLAIARKEEPELFKNAKITN